MNSFRFLNVMKNTKIINTFNSGNSNITNIKMQHCQIMTTNTNKVLKFDPIIKKSNTKQKSNTTSIRHIYQNQKPNFHQIQKDCQENLLFVWLELYKLNCLNILVHNVYFHKEVNNQ